MTGKELKILREQFKKTQKEVADTIGTDVTRISEWENEKHKISKVYQKLLKDFFAKFS
jgi:DNA-binding transcriptional regulator YiaG